MLYNHQKQILKDNPLSTGLWLGCGGGKTRIALSLAQGKTLVLAPKTQRDDKNWEREVEKMNTNTNINVLSKEDFKKVDPGPFDTLIIDEAHCFLGVYPMTMRRKGVTLPKASQLFYHLRNYVKKYQPERVYLLTATISKTPLTIWAAGVILGKFTFDSFYAFRDKYYIKRLIGGREIYMPKTDSFTQEELVRVIKSLGYTGRLEDWFDVPDQNYKTDYVELTKEQLQYIRQVKLDYPEPIVQVGKRHQVENGVFKDEGQYIKDNKIERLQEYALQFEKMIIFAKYTEQIQKIKDSLKDYDVYTLTGQTKDRGELLTMLKGKEKYILVVQSQVSAGWELPECPVMIFASNGYSFVDREQAEGRILRANALKKNLYIDLVAKGGVDEAVKKALDKKQDFNEKVYATGK
jgi:hypothetical protein